MLLFVLFGSKVIYQPFLNSHQILFRRTLIIVSSREIIVVCGYLSYGAWVSYMPFWIFFRLSCPPCLKEAVVNTNVTISKNVRHIEQ